MSELNYRKLHRWKYELLEGTHCEVEIKQVARSEFIRLCEGVLTIAPHYAWDGASFIARDTKDFMRGSLFHDALCELVGKGLLDKKYRKYADQLLRQHCLEDGMSKFRAWYVYIVVRGWSRLKGM